MAVNGVRAKPATAVGVGDRVTTRIHQRERDVEVVRLVDKRVGAPIAVECYLDHSPEPPERDAPVGRRDPGTGRPTKRDRRQLEQWRRRNR